MIAVDMKYVLTVALKAFQDRHCSISRFFSECPVRPKIANAQIQDHRFVMTLSGSCVIVEVEKEDHHGKSSTFRKT
jgi:hypothetical protein